jgi:hypothetical protein
MDVSRESPLPRTPPRTLEVEEQEAEQETLPDSEEERDIEEEEEKLDIEEEEEEHPKQTRALRKWVLLESWDRTDLLDSDIDAEVLRIANERMEESGMVELPAARMPARQKWKPSIAHSRTVAYAESRSAYRAMLRALLSKHVAENIRKLSVIQLINPRS